MCGEKDGDVARVGERGCGAGRRTERLTGVTGLLRRIQGEEDGMHGMQQGWGGGAARCGEGSATAHGAALRKGERRRTRLLHGDADRATAQA